LSISAETKTVFAAYERLLAAGDAAGLAGLRASIERRIDELEAFYLQHVEDERSVLFEKQRLKLRKLLAEYDAAPGAASASGFGQGVYGAYPGSGAASANGAGAGYTGGGLPEGVTLTTRQIREDTRLVLSELLAWFLQAGSGEMPEVSPEVVEKVFANVTRTNLDGKMSIRDLRQWYISFGKRALREGLGVENDLVHTALLQKKKAAGASAGAPAAAGGASAVGEGERHRALYAWEKGAEGVAEGQGGPGSPGAGPSAPMGLPNHMLEFQLRLTPEEYAAVQLRRRALEAEAKYKARVRAGAAKAGNGSGSGAALGATPRDSDGPTDRTGPYKDPAKSDTFIFRSPDPKKWCVI
jgi:hypothetical protein